MRPRRPGGLVAGTSRSPDAPGPAPPDRAFGVRSLRPRRPFRLVFPWPRTLSLWLVLPYPDGTTQILGRIALVERPPISLISRLLAVADMTLPALVIQLIPLAPITPTALLMVLIALPSPGVGLLSLGGLVALLVFPHFDSLHW